jgi:5-formyltetrahydrofolate cyclo-ligase
MAPAMPADHHGFIPSSAEEVLRRRVKAELRKRMRGLRKALPASACARRSESIVDRLVGLELVARAKTIALFWPIEDRHEVDLRPLDEMVRSGGARVAYPILDPEAGTMDFRFVEDVTTMRPHPFGHSEPGAHDIKAAPGQIDVIVVPALAVDPRGHRIGYGGGHYDRTLALHAPSTATVAVVFDFQLIADAPQTEGDVAVAWVVTDARTLACVL